MLTYKPKLYSKSVKALSLVNALYKQIITYIDENNNDELNEMFDYVIQDKEVNVYEKFLVLIYLYDKCVSSTVTFNHNQIKTSYLIRQYFDALNKPVIEPRTEDFDGFSIKFDLPLKFYKVTDEELNKQQVTYKSMCDYTSSCIRQIIIDGQTTTDITEELLSQLPSIVFVRARQFIQEADNVLQSRTFTSLGLSIYTLFIILKQLFSMEPTYYIDTEYVCRKHIKLNNFDELTFSEIQQFLTLFNKEQQEQQDAINSARSRTNT